MTTLTLTCVLSLVLCISAVWPVAQSAAHNRFTAFVTFTGCTAWLLFALLLGEYHFEHWSLTAWGGNGLYLPLGVSLDALSYFFCFTLIVVTLLATLLLSAKQSDRHVSHRLALTTGFALLLVLIDQPLWFLSGALALIGFSSALYSNYSAVRAAVAVLIVLLVGVMLLPSQLGVSAYGYALLMFLLLLALFISPFAQANVANNDRMTAWSMVFGQLLITYAVVRFLFDWGETLSPSTSAYLAIWANCLALLALLHARLDVEFCKNKMVLWLRCAAPGVDWKRWPFLLRRMSVSATVAENKTTKAQRLTAITDVVPFFLTLVPVFWANATAENAELSRYFMALALLFVLILVGRYVLNQLAQTFNLPVLADVCLVFVPFSLLALLALWLSRGWLVTMAQLPSLIPHSTVALALFVLIQIPLARILLRHFLHRPTADNAYVAQPLTPPPLEEATDIHVHRPSGALRGLFLLLSLVWPLALIVLWQALPLVEHTLQEMYYGVNTVVLANFNPLTASVFTNALLWLLALTSVVLAVGLSVLMRKFYRHDAAHLVAVDDAIDYRQANRHNGVRPLNRHDQYHTAYGVMLLKWCVSLVFLGMCLIWTT